MLTGPAGQISVVAGKLELRVLGLAHSRNDDGYMSVLLHESLLEWVHGRLMNHSWTPLVDGTEACENYAGVDIDLLPAETRRVELTVSMPGGISAAKHIPGRVLFLNSGMERCGIGSMIWFHGSSDSKAVLLPGQNSEALDIHINVAKLTIATIIKDDSLCESPFPLLIFFHREMWLRGESRNSQSRLLGSTE